MQEEVAGVCFSSAGRFLETNVSYVIAGEMWHSSSAGCAPGNVRERSVLIHGTPRASFLLGSWG